MTPVSDSFRSLWRSIVAPRKRTNGSIPVNKSADGIPTRRLPQMDNPILLGAAAVGAVGAGLAVTRLRSSGRGGRDERFSQWLTVALEEAGFPIRTEGDHVQCVTDVKVSVLEGFGKLPLVNADVAVDVDSPLWSPVVSEQIVDVLAQAAWHNPEIAPVAVRARIVADSDGVELCDMRSIGAEAEVALPADLFRRFGAPASDPTWEG